MSDPTAAICAALLTRLRAAGLKVYDEVPRGQPLPYVSIGPVQPIPEEYGCSLGSEVFVQLDVWADAPAHSATSPLVSAIRVALRSDLVIIGHDTVEQELTDARLSKDPATGKARAIVTLRLATEPA